MSMEGGTVVVRSGGDVGLACSRCKQNKKREDYSRSQWKRHERRRCRECVKELDSLKTQAKLEKIKKVEARRAADIAKHKKALEDAGQVPSAIKDVVLQPDRQVDSEILRSTEALSNCEKVLSALAQDITLFATDKRFRKIRSVIVPLLQWRQSEIFDGKTFNEFAKDRQDRKRKRLERRTRKKAAQAHDRNAINKRGLRAERLQHLQSLLDENHEAIKGVNMIEDGSTQSDTPPVLAMIADGAAVGHDKTQENQTKSETMRPRACYICKARYTQLHHFYRGRFALLTGGRVKIGFRIGLKLLRCGVTLIVTTRFPHDAAKRYAAEKDYSTFKDRLQVFGLDLRDLARLEEFCALLKTRLGRLDIIINNACQTIRRPPSYYAHLLEGEKSPPLLLEGTSSGGDLESSKTEKDSKIKAKSNGSSNPLRWNTAWKTSESLPDASGKSLTLSSPTRDPAEMSQMAVCSTDLDDGKKSFPKGAYDVNKQQLDLRTVNSWKLKLEQVESAELAEVFAINSLAPFIINARLKELMLQAAAPRFIINVSAMEGKFYRFKTANHPHTNMAKAALNMMTRTSAAGYSEDMIFMNSVDTGWINDENPLPTAKKIAANHNFQTPLDEIDAAARVLDPIMIGLNKGELLYGKFLKDYKTTEW